MISWGNSAGKTVWWHFVHSSFLVFHNNNHFRSCRVVNMISILSKRQWFSVSARVMKCSCVGNNFVVVFVGKSCRVILSGRLVFIVYSDQSCFRLFITSNGEPTWITQKNNENMVINRVLQAGKLNFERGHPYHKWYNKAMVCNYFCWKMLLPHVNSYAYRDISL